MGSSTGLSFMSIPFIVIVDKVTGKRPLPIKILIPFGDLDTYYWCYYALEAFHICTSIFVATGHDLLFVGFILRACHQFDLLKKRTEEISDISKKFSNLNYEKRCEIEKNVISKMVKHHLLIYE